MLKGSSKRIPLMNVICMVLMLAVFILQFVPFWGIDGKTVSISNYIWLPVNDEKCIALTASFVEQFTGYNINSIVLVAVGQLVASAIGLFLFTFKRNNSFKAIATVLAGGFGVWACLLKPVYQLGTLWQLHLAVYAITFIVGLYTLIISVRNIFVED